MVKRGTRITGVLSLAAKTAKSSEPKCLLRRYEVQQSSDKRKGIGDR